MNCLLYNSLMSYRSTLENRCSLFQILYKCETRGL
nr:MAG TPA: hypothetical protein [Caudoviricetes sp.]